MSTDKYLHQQLQVLSVLQKLTDMRKTVKMPRGGMEHSMSAVCSAGTLFQLKVSQQLVDNR